MRNKLWFASCKATIAGMLILSSLSLATYSQGFGMIKKDAHFSRLRPPRILLSRLDVAVRVTTLGVSRATSASTFQSSLESGLKTGDPRTNLNSADPNIRIDCQVGGDSKTETWSKKSEYQRQKVRVEEVWNEQKKKMEKKDIYEDVKVEVPYLRVNWNASIAFRIESAKSANIIASDQNTYTHSGEYKEGKLVPQSPPGVEGWIDQQARKIAAYIVPTRERVRILLPKGKLDSVSDKIEERKLAEALKELESIPPLKKQEDDSYKFYLLGACYEAMAYVNDRTESLDRYLEQAAENYAKAIAVKPGEKYFTEAQERLRVSTAMYKTLAERQYLAKKTPKDAGQTEALNSSRSTEPPPPSVNPAPAATTPFHRQPMPARRIEPKPSENEPASQTTDALTNETIMKLVKAGLSEENIIATISEASAVSFDLSPNGQVQLIQGGVSNRIISAMRNGRKSK